MTSAVAILRTTGSMETLPNGDQAPEWATVHVDLPARIGSYWGSSPSRSQNVGGAEVRVGDRVLHLPASTSDLRDGDFIEITAGENVGTVWRVVESDWQDQSTARRLPVTSVQRPTEWG